MHFKCVSTVPHVWNFEAIWLAPCRPPLGCEYQCQVWPLSTMCIHTQNTYQSKSWTKNIWNNCSPPGMFSLSFDYLIIHVSPIFDSFPLTSQPVCSPLLYRGTSLSSSDWPQRQLRSVVGGRRRDMAHGGLRNLSLVLRPWLSWTSDGDFWKHD